MKTKGKVKAWHVWTLFCAGFVVFIGLVYGFIEAVVYLAELSGL